MRKFTPGIFVAMALAFTTGIRRAETVLVNGKVVVRDSRLVGLDAAELFRAANKQAAQMVERAAAKTKLDFLARPSDRPAGAQ